MVPIPSEPEHAERPSPVGITVIVTAYRRYDYLRKAVESALTQTAPRSSYEILVVKDRPEPDLDRWLAEQNVEVVNSDLPRIGQMIAEGVRRARHEVVCFLDDDDQYLPHKLLTVRQEFERTPDLVLFRHGLIPVDRAGEPDRAWSRVHTVCRDSFDLTSNDPWPRSLARIFRQGLYVNMTTMSVRREVLRSSIDLIEKIDAAPDTTVGVVAWTHPGIHRFARDCLSLYRIHDSMSHRVVEGSLAPSHRDLRRTLRSLEVVGDWIAQPTYRRNAPLAYHLWEAHYLAGVNHAFVEGVGRRPSLSEWLGFGWSSGLRQQPFIFRDFVRSLPKLASLPRVPAPDPGVIG